MLYGTTTLKETILLLADLRDMMISQQGRICITQKDGQAVLSFAPTKICGELQSLRTGNLISRATEDFQETGSKLKSKMPITT